MITAYQNTWIIKWIIQGLNMNVSKKLSIALLACAMIALNGSALANTDSKASQQTSSNHTQDENLQQVNINVSTVAQLETLKGVGSHRAKAIVQYRNEIGKYTHIAQLTAVKGIGPKIIEDNKERIIL